MADKVIWGTELFQVPEYFNFADVIDDWAQKEKEGKRQNNGPALWWIDGQGNEIKWSFQDVVLNSKKTANVLSTAADIKLGDRVMVMLPTIPEYWLMQAACCRTGGVCVITPNSIGPNELERRIAKLKPVCVVAAPCDHINSELLDVVDQVAISGRVQIRSLILVNRMKYEQRINWLSFENLFEKASADYQSVKTLSSAPCLGCFTTGTTGNSKMVEHSHASLWLGGTSKQVERFEESELCWNATYPGWAWLLADNFFYIWSVGAGAFAHYKNQILTPKETLETLEAYPITSFTASVAKYVKALDGEDLKNYKFPNLKYCVIGGEKVNKELIRKWKEKTGVELLDVYGLTEISTLTFKRDEEEEHIGSVGKPFNGVDMLVVDDDNQEVPHGTTGKIAIRVKPYYPVGLFNGYVDEPQKTEACFSGDFYFTGDLGRRDASGHFWISGRTDDVIIVDGANINPVEVEDCLKEHPAVLDCAVVSSPLAMGLQATKAFVELKKGFKMNGKVDSSSYQHLVKDLQNHVSYHTGEWLRPDKIEFIDDMPRTIVGKVDRLQLKTREWRAVTKAQEINGRRDPKRIT